MRTVLASGPPRLPLLILTFLAVTAFAGASQVERHLSGDQKLQQWATNSNSSADIKRIKVCRTDTLCKLRFKEGKTPRTRVRNMVVPLRYDSEAFSISEAFTRQVREAFD